MRNNSKHYDDLRAYCETIAIVDTHDHTDVCGPKYEDPVQVVVGGYFGGNDLRRYSNSEDMRIMMDTTLPLKERWPLLEKAWRKTSHTGYAQVSRRVLKKFYGVEKLTLSALEGMQDKLMDLTNEKLFDSILGEAGIEIRLFPSYPGNFDPATVLDGTAKLPPRGLMVTGLDDYHRVKCYSEVQALAAPLGRTITSLDEYLDLCREIFEGYKRFGSVGFKEASAYLRKLEFGNPTRGEAEEIFNWFMTDPRRSASYPDGVKPLEDYLFNEFMRMVRDIDMPVQIHTGLLSGMGNDITNANAVELISMFERHPDVKFDLFHANWPYSGELLFLVKNYPNVAMNFCWANIIDPIYCQNLYKQALSSVPHSKIHAYGADCGGCADRAWAHADITRDNIAIALSDMIDADYLDMDDAKEIARMWLRDNANEFFRLGLN